MMSDFWSIGFALRFVLIERLVHLKNEGATRPKRAAKPWLSIARLRVRSATVVVAAAPTVGERKKGDLAELLIYKFPSQNRLYLLGYTFHEAVRLAYLEAAG